LLAYAASNLGECELDHFVLGSQSASSHHDPEPGLGSVAPAAAFRRSELVALDAIDIEEMQTGLLVMIAARLARPWRNPTSYSECTGQASRLRPGARNYTTGRLIRGPTCCS